MSWRAAITVPLIGVLLAGCASLGAAPGALPASFAPAGPVTVTGPTGQQVTVSQVTGLDPIGAAVAVSGTGFDEDKGIYVAFCVEPQDGQPPTPCGGGADASGALGLSHWISSNPPPYGEGLAKPFESGGVFAVELSVSSRIGDIDCTIFICGIATRADHTRTADRSQDVFVPITFAGAA